MTTFFKPVESAELGVIQAATTKKHGWLPVLTVLFLISYGIMTLLIVEQGQTIESQRALIRELFRDSTELSASKMKAHQQATKSQPAVGRNPSSQNSASKTPSTQAPGNNPSTQAGPQHRVQNQTEKRKPFQMPSRPASDLTDAARTLITI